MGFLLKAFLFGLVVYYIIKSIGLVMARMMGGQGPRQTDIRNNSRREGEINIDYHPGKDNSHRSHKKSDGEYIDYEEIK